MGFLQKMIIRYRRFMEGRYGMDNLSRFLYALGLILWLVNTFLGYRVLPLTIITLVLLGLCFFRMFSKNIQGRYNENTRYLMLKSKILGFFRGRKASGSSARGASQRGSDPDHKVYKCPACGQKARVPLGRGKIEITCPKCGNHFKRRT